MTLPKSFSFYFSVFKDEIYAVRLAWQLNKYFSNVEVIVITDGPPDEYSLAQAQKFNPNLKIFREERLKNKRYGGFQYTQRNFNILLKASKSETFIKLDPDSYINKSCDIPDYDWFGNVHNLVMPYLNYKFDFISGGAMGLSRKTLISIVDSELLLDQSYDDPSSFYNRYEKYRKFGDPLNESKAIRREDWAIGSVCKQLNINPTNWDKVCCLETDIYSSDNKTEYDFYEDFAIVHPVRTRW